MHVAQAVLVVLLARHAGTWMFAVAVAVCGVILVGSVLLGWHYAVDGVFSVAATLLIWRVVGRVLGGPPDHCQVRPS